MRIQSVGSVAALAVVALFLLPGTLAATPLHGTVTTCSSTTSCHFVFNSTKGTGWANTTSTQLSLQLPGETKASYNLSYSTYIGSLIGTYTYWTVGNFYGTDVNTGHVVYGTTDTNYTITCHGHSGRGGGCTYTYTTDNGTIVVHFTSAELTSTAISCSPGTIHPGGKANCTVTVSNLWNGSNYPTGKVHVSTFGLAGLSNKGTCVLSSGTCSLTFRAYDNTCGAVTVEATYSGNTAFYKSSGSTVEDVIVNGGC
jgi:hypothetical protein